MTRIIEGPHIRTVINAYVCDGHLPQALVMGLPLIYINLHLIYAHNVQQCGWTNMSTPDYLSPFVEQMKA